MYTEAIAQRALDEFATDVRDGLQRPGQKVLLSKYLYDEIGSELFEAITLLPEYGLTRACQRLLHRHAAEIVDRLAEPVVVAELGSGTGKKTRWILECLARTQPVFYHPIDISRAALDRCEQELGWIESISVVGFEAAYLDGLRKVTALRRPEDHVFVLFLGSTIGNFDRPAGETFLGKVRETLLEGDALLLATDLVKPVDRMLRAYDDPIGVTAAFNMNLLARINRELGGSFDLDEFEHHVRWNAEECRIEMHLRSLEAQSVAIRRADIRVAFEKGETIWTESSHKFALDEVPGIAERTGFRCRDQWIDHDWPFAQSLFVAV